MTTIGTSLVITGEVTSKEDITIHGQVKGQISMVEGTLLVAPTAHIEADVDVTSVTIHGNMSGKVAAGQRVELTPTATVKGTLIAPAVVLREGATFNGKIQVERKGASATKSTAKVN
jgi:cytoskeletal protein CcmA (bactofilin family)